MLTDHGMLPRPRRPPTASPTPRPASSSPRSPRVIVMIYGEGKHRAATWNALKKSLSVQGRDPVQWQGEAKIGYGALKKMTKSRPSGQVLGIELSSDGRRPGSLMRSGQSYPAKFDCKDCTRDEPARNQPAFRAGSLLDEAAQPGKTTRTPPEAACLLRLRSVQCNSGRQQPRHRSPNWPKLMKGPVGELRGDYGNWSGAVFDQRL